MIDADVGGGALLFGAVASSTWTLIDVERVEVRALGGADTIIVGDLAGTDVTQVAIDLASTAGGKTADTKVDTVTVYGGAINDFIGLAASGSEIVVTGLPAQVKIDHAGKTDQLTINGLDGNDIVDARAWLPARSHCRSRAATATISSSAAPAMTPSLAATGGDGALLGAGNDRVHLGPRRRQRCGRG